jgi:asparagine synthase (glutamine-hydrolysing)
MSGVAGIIRFCGAPVGPGLLEAMTAAMAHRGPDGIGHWIKDSVALGQCMLCTTPESLEEKQPLRNEDESLVLVLDGRVDNQEELRRELAGRGLVLRDRSDAELVLRAYETWGRKCLAHLDGDFALVIWDARRRTAFCARDRMGNKPFNYHWDGKTFTFSSELHAILAMPWVEHELNEGMLAEYLSFEWYSRDETPWKGVYRLVGAHWMEIGDSGRQSGQYWRPDLHSPVLYGNDEEYVEHYRELFADTVRRMSRTHHTLAFEVSGGLDSSSIFAVAANLRRRQELPAPGMVGFTLRFDDDSEANELTYARALCAHVGTPVHEVDPTSKPLSWYRDWARTYREFPGYPNGVMGWGIRKAAREQGCRALLVGAGGDEWLTGSRDYYAEELVSGRWRNLYQCMRADFRDVGAKDTWWWMGRSGAVEFLPDLALRLLRTWLARYRGTPPGRPEWLSPQLREVVSRRKTGLGGASHGVEFGRAGQRAQYETLYSPYDVLARESEERLAASLGIELRLPLWSTAMVQFAFSTPERLRLRGGTSKVLHRRAMAGLLPALVLERTSKADFMVTFRRYGDELKSVLSAGMPQDREEWVLRGCLETTFDRWGEPSYGGVPEWMLWSLFGWRALLPEMGP